MSKDTSPKSEELVENVAPSEEPQAPVAETSEAVSVESSSTSAEEAAPGDTSTETTAKTIDSSSEAAPPKTKKPKKPKKQIRYYIPLEIGQKLTGKIKTITKFGAFVDLNMSVDGLIHISELSRQRVDQVTDVVSKGEEVDVWVKSVDRERGRIGLTMVKPIQRRYRDIKEDDVLEGEITRIEDYGVFVDIGLPREGLVHISELSHEYVKIPADVVAAGDTVQVKVLKVEPRRKQVNLSIKALLELPEPEVVEEEIEEEEEEVVLEEEMPTTMAVAFGRVSADKKPSKKKQAKRRKRSKAMDEVVARTLKVSEQEES
jgi:predicted RNA-binding protein with RPS1 domain